jgi:phosphotransferase system IIA component
MELPASELGKENGMDLLISQLDKLFLRDDKDKAYEAYKNFDNYFEKGENMTVSDYIIELDKRYNKAKKYDMTLPEAVLAFKIVDNAELAVQKKQLALTACIDLKYKAMKSTLQRIFGETASSSSEHKPDSQTITAKQEPVFFSAMLRTLIKIGKAIGKNT